MYHPLLEKQMAYFKHLKKQIEARETKKAWASLRHQSLQRQKMRNYQLEFDRVRNILENTNVQPATKRALEKRRAELEKLGALAISGIVD